MIMADTPHMDILLVEDNPVHARIMMRALELGEDDQVHHVEDGADALAYLHVEDNGNGNGNGNGGDGEADSAELPDLVLLDLQLPTVDGFEVLEAMRQSDATRHVPVIVISTSDQQHDIARAYGAGANAFLIKPADFGRFIEQMKALRQFWCEAAELPET